MYYQEIFGWFDFDRTYNKAIDQFDNGWFVEIGCFQGRSACYLAETIKQRGKNIKLVCVDLWPNIAELIFFGEKGVGQGDEKDINVKLGRPLMEVFIDHMNSAGVRDILYPVRCNSVQAANLFPDEFFKFVFIDAGHTEQQVYDDVSAWLPKLAPGGLMAGHDFGNPGDAVYKGVQQALGENFSRVVKVEGNTWEYQT